MVTDTVAPVVDTTAAPVTEGPAVTTDAPVVTTDAPAVTTDAPAVTTDAPAVTTDAPAVTTDAPVVTTDAPVVTTAAPKPEDYYPNIDEIVQAFRTLTTSEYYKRLNYDDKILVLELLSGGEVGKINEVLDNMGHERFLTFLYKIPLKYFDDLMQFVLGSIQRENSINAASA